MGSSLFTGNDQRESPLRSNVVFPSNEATIRTYANKHVYYSVSQYDMPSIIDEPYAWYYQIVFQICHYSSLIMTPRDPTSFSIVHSIYLPSFILYLYTLSKPLVCYFQYIE